MINRDIINGNLGKFDIKHILKAYLGKFVVNGDIIKGHLGKFIVNSDHQPPLKLRLSRGNERHSVMVRTNKNTGDEGHLRSTHE